MVTSELVVSNYLPVHNNSMRSPLGLARGGLEVLKRDGLKDFSLRGTNFVYMEALKGLHYVTGKSSRGENIFEKDWDALVVLDGLRTDLMEENISEYDFLGTDDVDRFHSLGSASQEWMDRNFTDEYEKEMSETVMVTGNAFSKTRLDEDSFQHLEEAWRYAWDEETEMVNPEPITDAAINLGREKEPERMIVHYMQPHYPFKNHPEIGCGVKPKSFGKVNSEKQPWDELLVGDVSQEELWEAYRQNLHYVMNEVERLGENLEAEKAVITADHGNGLGKLDGQDRWVYGHLEGVAVDSLRKVPWVETGFQDLELEYPQTYTESEHDRQEVMRALGYTEE